MSERSLFLRIYQRILMLEAANKNDNETGTNDIITTIPSNWIQESAFSMTQPEPEPAPLLLGIETSNTTNVKNEMNTGSVEAGGGTSVDINTMNDLSLVPVRLPKHENDNPKEMIPMTGPKINHTSTQSGPIPTGSLVVDTPIAGKENPRTSLNLIPIIHPNDHNEMITHIQYLKSLSAPMSPGGNSNDHDYDNTMVNHHEPRHSGSSTLFDNGLRLEAIASLVAKSFAHPHRHHRVSGDHEISTLPVISDIISNKAKSEPNPKAYPEKQQGIGNCNDNNTQAPIVDTIVNFQQTSTNLDIIDTTDDIDHEKEEQTDAENIYENNGDRSRSVAEIVTLDELPEWYDAYDHVYHGYRLNYSLKEALQSAFSIKHNEFVNFWTEFIPALSFAVLNIYWYYNYSFYWKDANWGIRIATFNPFSQVLTLIVSSCTHLLHCVNEEYTNFFWKCDYIAIVTHTTSTGAAYTYLMFYCESEYYLFTMMFCYFFYAFACIGTCIWSQDAALREVFMGANMVMTLFFPYICQMVIVVFKYETIATGIWIWWTIVNVATLWAALMRQFEIPEIWLNTREKKKNYIFNYVFTSHNWWHLGGFTAELALIMGLFNYVQYRAQNGTC